MIELCYPVQAIRSEQYRTGMTSILGRRLFVAGGQATIFPFTNTTKISDGDWAVEVGHSLYRVGEQSSKVARIEVLTDAEYHKTYRRLMTFQDEDQVA